MVASLIVLVAGTPACAAREQAHTLATTVLAAARWAGVPPEVLAAVTWVESRGQPWALAVAGRAFYPSNRSEALVLVRAAGARADIGLAQIHYPIWGPVFGLQPEDLLDPWINLHVAASILRLAMDREPGSWGGVGRYHSATPWRKWQYAGRVAAVVRALRPATPPQGIDLTR